MAIILLIIFRFTNCLLTLCFVFSCQAASLLRSATAVSQRVINIELDFLQCRMLFCTVWSPLKSRRFWHHCIVANLSTKVLSFYTKTIHNFFLISFTPIWCFYLAPCRISALWNASLHILYMGGWLQFHPLCYNRILCNSFVHASFFERNTLLGSKLTSLFIRICPFQVPY